MIKPTYIEKTGARGASQMANDTQTRRMKQKAGHQEILGETIAKFEFFSHGWNPYSRFLDVDKVDLILRRRRDTKTIYREIQIKFGKLHTCASPWERKLFSHSSWAFFSETDLAGLTEHGELFVAYVLSLDDGFKGDMFIFSAQKFARVVRAAPRSGENSYRVLVSCTNSTEKVGWYLRRTQRKFEALTDTTVLNVTTNYRNFDCLL
jgi:hypothetical protein